MADDLWSRVGEMLLGRWGGPFTFRLVLQPVMAALLALRAGLRDAREGRPAFLARVVRDPAQRAALLRQGWHEVRRVFLLALVLDLLYELIVYRWIYPLQALLVAALLAIVPYLLVRGPATRLCVRWRDRRRGHGGPRAAPR